MKKVIIPIIVILILAVAGGFFWWQNRKIKGSPNDYVIKETEQGTIVENKKAGLTVNVPEGWVAEKIENGEGLMGFYSPNIEGELQNGKIAPPLRKGCIIHIGILYEEMTLTQLKFEAKYNLNLLDAKSEEFEEVTINNYQALKATADTQKIGSIIGVDVPCQNRAYSFSLLFAPYNKNNCIQEFDKFLETVLIQ